MEHEHTFTLDELMRLDGLARDNYAGAMFTSCAGCGETIAVVR